MNEALKKLERLKKYFLEIGNAGVAFSGGVDSSLLLKVAHDVLRDKAIGITADGVFVPKKEIEVAKKFCADEGIKHINIGIDFLSIAEVKKNSKERCYYCKKALLKQIIATAEKEGIKNIVEGTNVDDEKDYRPGMKAVAELGVKSPLREVGLSKKEIRELLRAMKMTIAEKESNSCLATRIVYGEKISTDTIAKVAAAEEYLQALGFKQLRVRVHGGIARIEIMTKEFFKFMEKSAEVNLKIKSLGFEYVTLDLGGYRRGSMNI